MLTVVDAIADQAGGPGTLTVLDAGTDVEHVEPWRAVHERARRMSTVFDAEGLGPGRRVGLVGDTGLDLVAALQAGWLTGAAVTVLPPPAGGRRLDNLLAIVADADLDLVVSDAQAASALSTKTRVLPLTALANRANRAAAAIPYRPRPTDLAVLQYTSGSTRTPRGVPVTHGHLAANLDAIRAATHHSHPSRALSWLPLNHDMGLVAFLTLPMSCGCPVVLQSPAAFARRPASWLQAMSRHRITTSGAPNFAYVLMNRLLAAGLDVDLRSVRWLVSGGEPVDAATMARFATLAGRRGLDRSALVAAYGLAESTLAATMSPPGAGLLVDRIDLDVLAAEGRAVPARPGSRARELVRVGRPVPGTELRITGPHTGDQVAERVVGHVELRGPSVVGHYRGEPPPPPGAWLHTGDLGYLTGGELVVCGRVKDVLNACGRNVFPQDIEAAATEVPGVRPGGAVAFGIAGNDGDRLVVAVESRGADPADVRAAVTAAVLDEVGLCPADVVALRPGRLPKTSSGKLRRAEARRRYHAGEFDLHHAPERTTS